ncbi:MAG: nucleotidyl transferase AbiEii/AbiGii toxin family protein [Candidatus Thiodiazotropha sp. (ex Epidulcina cf. delphinae)]|nr:nucleotidyl transferase AbiEii/AbiGii toxin family protein [Candidatus Thiodiazotropha sp. (ex Epidulcina cf. delphinae)]
MKESPYFKQAQLMLRVMPHVAAEECFVLKGGTAINFFVRNLPRLSVDIDLTWLPLGPRDTALANISQALHRIATGICKTMPEAAVQESRPRGAEHASKLFASTGEATIKIEPNLVLRGTVFPPEERELSVWAEELFELSASIKTAAFADLYGGKLCAALYRRHPRDLFDIKILMENEGITDEIRSAFIMYLASHNRPMSELLNPNRKDFRQVFEQEFVGMAVEEVEYDELVAIRESLIETIKKTMTENEKKFLLSVKHGNPAWDLMPVAGIDRLPAIQYESYYKSLFFKEK